MAPSRKASRSKKSLRKKRIESAERNELCENLLRPSKYLGYDRNMVGLHLMRRESYLIAESQFRRAIWLNPFEPVFKAHLAFCLYMLGNFSEAKDWAEKTMEQDQGNEVAKEIIRLVGKQKP